MAMTLYLIVSSAEELNGTIFMIFSIISGSVKNSASINIYKMTVCLCRIVEIAYRYASTANVQFSRYRIWLIFAIFI